MKQRIVIADLLELTTYQKERLRELWRPQINDVACASICTDVENETFRHVEFVIGDISVHQTYHGYSISLRNILSMGPLNPANLAGYGGPESGTEPAPGFPDNDFAAAGYQLEEFNKDECLPLLHIGQLIEMLQRLGYGDEYFYITIPSDPEQNYGLGRDGYPGDYENPELCDVLLECLKAKL